MNWLKVYFQGNDYVETEGYSGADLKYLIRYIILHSIDFSKEKQEKCDVYHFLIF